MEMAGPRTVRAEGPGSIAIGGDAVNSIFVTGGVNQFFVGQYERLAEAYIAVEPLYRELQIAQFTGRSWLLDAIDAFVDGHDRGYVVLEAEAGMGKTAFMLWMSKQRGCVHHFVRLMVDPDDVGAAMRNLTAQLIRSWDLQGRAVGGLLPPAASRPDFFQEVLTEAADKRDALYPEEPIVIVVDGLNETKPRAGQNPLGLPQDLPPGVYFLVSQRTVHVPLVTTVPRTVVRLTPDSPENLDDMRQYLTMAAAWPDIARRLAAGGIAPTDFVERMTLQCGGVWLVLRYVLAEVRAGTRPPDELPSLPKGLWRYYAQFWGEWRRVHEEDWADVDLPLLAALTASRELASVDFLCKLAGIRTAHGINRAAQLFSDAWRPFLRTQEDSEGERYEAFHSSLVEFVAGEVEIEGLESAERAFVRLLSGASRRMHRQISDQYLEAWGGLTAGLPLLRDREAADIDGGYGRRQLVGHLIQSGADVTLHALLALEWEQSTVGTATGSSAMNVWYEVHRRLHAYGAYARDVQRAWRFVEDQPGAPSTQEGTSGRMVLELRYAVISASVNSLAGNIPADLLVLLLESKVISVPDALELAHEVPDGTARAEALTSLVPHVPDQARAEALRAALANVQAVSDGYWRVGELARLLPLLGAEHQQDALRIATGMVDPYDRAVALGLLGRAADGEEEFSLSPGHESDLTSASGLSASGTFVNVYLRRGAHAVTSLLTGTAFPDGKVLTAAEALAATRFVRHPRSRALMLTNYARAVAPESRREILQTALEVSTTIADEGAVGETLRRIALVLAAQQAEDPQKWVQHAIDCAFGIAEPAEQAKALLALVGMAPPALRTDVMDLGLAAVAEISDEQARTEILRHHADLLVEPFRNGQLPDVVIRLDNVGRLLVLSALAGHLGDTEREELLAQMLADMSRESEDDGAKVLTEIAGRLPSKLLGPARTAVLDIHDPEVRGRVWAEVAARAFGLSGSEVSFEDIREIDDPFWKSLAQLLASRNRARAAPGGSEAGLPNEPGLLPWRVEALAASGRVDAAFALCDAVAEPGERAVLLMRMAAGAGDASLGHRNPLEEARHALDAVSDGGHRSRLTCELALATARAGRPAVALQIVQQVTDNRSRCAAVRGIARMLASDMAEEALSTARDISDRELRAEALSALTGLVADARPNLLEDHVREVLHLLAESSRSFLLGAMQDLLPALPVLAGPAGLLQVASDLTAVARWWP